MINHPYILRQAKRYRGIVRSLRKKITVTERTNTIKNARKVYFTIIEALEKDNSPRSQYFAEKLRFINSMLVDYAAIEAGVYDGFIYQDTPFSEPDKETFILIFENMIRQKITDWIMDYFG